MRTAVVTGASRGIGLAVVQELVADDIFVCGVSRHSSDALEALVQEGKAVFFPCDLAQPQQVQQLAQQILEAFPKVDILVHNAGQSCIDIFQCISTEQAEHLYQVNLLSPILLTRLLLPHMIQQHSGSIVNITSIWGETGASCEVDYSVTKSGLIGFTKALAKEVAPSGIRVNGVAPGVIDTEMNRCFSEETLQELAEEIPLGRLGLPREVATAVAFLTSEKASYITGQILSVNGGEYC